MSGVCSKSVNQSDSRMFKIATRDKNKHKFYLDAETADVHFIFTVDGKRKKVPAHKLILANESDVFHVMFYGKWKREEEIDIKDVSADAFEEFLACIYCENVTITKKNVADVMKLADIYDVAECVDICETFMKENMPIEDICSSLQSAIDYNRGELEKFCKERISEQPKAVFASDQFSNCSQDVLKCILEIDYLLCGPVEVFNACMLWAIHACKENGTVASAENVRDKLGDCLYLIPFHLMTPFQVKNCVNRLKGLFDQEELVEIINIMGSPHPTALSKFKSRPPHPADRWDSACTSETFLDNGNKEKYWIKQNEVSPVVLDCDVLLCAVNILGIQHMQRRLSNKGAIEGVSLNATVKIALINNNLEDVVLSKQQINVVCNAFTAQAVKIRLAKPIVLEAKQNYEIQVTFDSDWAEEMFYVADAELCAEGIISTLFCHHTK